MFQGSPSESDWCEIGDDEADMYKGCINSRMFKQLTESTHGFRAVEGGYPNGEATARLFREEKY